MSTEESAGNGPDEHSPVERQVACSMTSTLLRRTRGTHGQQAVDELIVRTGVDYSSDFLEDIGNWIWDSEAVRLLEAAEEVLGDEHIGPHVGEDALRQHAGTPVATLLRSVGSPEAVFEQVNRAVAKFTTVTDMETLGLEPGHATIRAQARPRLSAPSPHVRVRDRATTTSPACSVTAPFTRPSATPSRVGTTRCSPSPCSTSTTSS